MRQLLVTPQAESDLIGIWVYTSGEWGVDKADQYLDELEEGMKRLIDHPSLGADYSHVLPGYRRMQIEHHAVFYNLAGADVVVVRVLHESMDAPARLLD